MNKELKSLRFVFGAASIDALARYELSMQVGLFVDSKLLEQVYAIHGQPAKIKINPVEIHPALLPYVTIPKDHFETYVDLRAQAKTTIRQLKESTSCTFEDFTYLISGIYFGKPLELYGIWRGSIPNPHIRKCNSNIGRKVAEIGFESGVNRFIEF